MREGVNGPILEVGGLVKDYVTRDAKLQQRVTRAVDGIDFEVHPGETFAIVGESGSGKSTVGRVLLKLTEATGGEAHLLGEEILELAEKRFRGLRRHIQMVFQDPLAAFDPRASIRSSLREFAEFGGGRSRAEMDLAVDEAVRDVGLPPEIADRRFVERIVAAPLDHPVDLRDDLLVARSGQVMPASLVRVEDQQARQLGASNRPERRTDLVMRKPLAPTRPKVFCFSLDAPQHFRRPRLPQMSAGLDRDEPERQSLPRRERHVDEIRI